MDVTLLLASTALAILAAPLHELTHALAARCFGFQNVGVDWRRLDCTYDVPQGTLLASVWLVGAAPLLIGVVIGAAWLTGLLAAPNQLEALPLVLALVIYAFGGGLADLRLTRIPTTN